jgi:DNA gyrase/topoisomerase IV subunit B
MTKTKTIEETYKKLTQREHVLERPGMYIGSVKKQMEELWIANEKDDSIRMEKQMIEYSPAFIKIFDEVLTNATDHSFRDNTVTIIKVDYSKETGEISVWNNGNGIPVQLHKEHNMYVPELIFGHLLSGSNYDDTTTRTGAGTNGLGSKVSNIYSKQFIVDTIDSKEKKRFIQEFSENMTQRTKPKITTNSGKSYTKITFIPDYSRFSMNGLEDDSILLIRKRVLDCIACTSANVQIYLNGERLRGKGLVDYTKYFFEGERVISESQVERIKGKGGVVTEYIWEYAIVPNAQYEQVSFVNGNSTTQGGKHVDYILYQIINRLKKMIEEKKRMKELKPNFIKDKLFIFLRATVANPSFNSQTKEQLTTPSKDFGCSVTVSDQFITKLYKSSIVEEIVEFCKMKESLDLAKTTDGKKRNKIYVPKLEDALWAGTAKSEQCTLILTEGLSAMTFALWGRSIVGPDCLGVFPLKGKVLNIRDATVSQLMNNEEINNLKQIVGLKQGVDYKDTRDLRYSKVMILTDADVDGSHIKGLLVNLFHHWWPSLLKLDFIQTLRTPIVKAIRGQKVLEFYTEQDYHKWKEGTNTKGYQIRYFKGLGTSKKEDAQETFRRIDQLRIDYYHKDNLCDESIVLAFEKDKNIKTKISGADETESNEQETNDNKETSSNYMSSDMKCSDKRKRWLAQYDRNSYIDATTNKVSYQDLIHKELIHFSIYDNLRSIPSLCDGLKPSQRKIMYYMLKNNINKVIKVAQLSGYVSAETGYHHGEASLQGAIVSMAQDFVGSNNLNLLYPDGNHGCLDPDTKIMMWDGSKKYAKHIKIGDELVGDDGYKRTVLKTTSGEDNMYEINIDDEIFVVNSQHKLTLRYSSHLNIFWRESDMSWRVTYFDPSKMKGVHKNISTNLSSDKKETYNKSSLTKEQAYNQMISFIQTLNIDKSGIFDIKVCDYLKLNNTDKHHFKSLKNNKCIKWNNNKNLPIDPYIFGSWLGDGNSNGSGITSIDTEIIKKWVIEMGKIDCEIIHDKVSENHDNYHYSIRKSGNGKRYCVGSGLICEGCTFKKSEICEWVSDIHNPILKRVKSQTTGKNNWQKTLIENNLWNNKHIPFEYMYTSKENRLQLLAGFIDTDGYVRFQNKVPRILISQSKRLRTDLIYELKFLCETLGYACKIYHGSKNRQTKNGEDASLLTLCITGDNLHEIPILLNRKKIQPYVLKRNLYISSFTVKSLGVGKYCGWEIDGNNRFLLGNFIITHNSRLLGGKDAASPRYIFTRLSDITSKVFDKRDSPLLKYLDDDGMQIEPEWFMPVLPMVLVNGCEGIGTGYSTYIPPFNPKDIVTNLLRVLDDKEPLPMTPYFKNFNGDLRETEPGSYSTSGKWERVSDTQVKITELPVGCWVTTYKEFLESLVESSKPKTTKSTSGTTKAKKQTVQLKDVQNKTRDENNDICFIVEFCKTEDLDKLIKTGTLEKTLRLTKSFTTNNMYLFNDDLILTKYRSATDILLDFFDIRIEFYESRRLYLVKQLQNELTLLNSKIRFINEYINGELDINRKSRDYIISLLEERDYPKLAYDIKNDIKNDSENEGGNTKSFDYLVRMPLISLSLEKIRELENHRDTRQNELNDLQSKTQRDLWKNDLDEIRKML